MYVVYKNDYNCMTNEPYRRMIGYVEAKCDAEEAIRILAIPIETKKAPNGLFYPSYHYESIDLIDLRKLEHDVELFLLKNQFQKE